MQEFFRADRRAGGTRHENCITRGGWGNPWLGEMFRQLKIVCSIEARMTSTRLPGKVLLEANGRPMLSHLISRLNTVGLIDEIVLATTHNSTDDILEQLAKESGISVHRGSEPDVLGRVVEAICAAEAGVVVRVTGDNPLCDPAIVQHMINAYCAGEAEYVGNARVRSYPNGMEVEVISARSLLTASENATDDKYREHTCLFIRDSPTEYSSIDVLAPEALHWPELSLTLDEIADYELITAVIEALEYEREIFGCSEIVQFLRKRPDLVALNKKVIRTVIE